MNYQKKFVSNAAEGLERKQEYIEKSQRSTQDSIRVSGSATDATLIVAALIPLWIAKDVDITAQRIEDEWESWREYFFKKRDINETFKELSQPF